MAKAKFKVGDRVRIANKSEYYCGDKHSSNPRDVVGTVRSYTPGRSSNSFTTEVDWDNGTINNYPDKDLNLVSKTSDNKSNLTVDKEFVMQAYESACSTWKEKIERKFPDLFPKEQFAKLTNRTPDEASLYYRTTDGSFESLKYGVSLIDGVAGHNDIPEESKYRGIYVHDPSHTLELVTVKTTTGHAILFKQKDINK